MFGHAETNHKMLDNGTSMHGRSGLLSDDRQRDARPDDRGLVPPTQQTATLLSPTSSDGRPRPAGQGQVFSPTQATPRDRDRSVERTAETTDRTDAAVLL